MGHSHSHGEHDEVRLSRLARTVLFAVLGSILLATIAGLFHLWPDSSKIAKVRTTAQFAAPGVTFPRARIESIAHGCNGANSPPTVSDPSVAQVAVACDTAHVKVLSGPFAGSETYLQLQGPLALSGLRPGDEVSQMHIPGYIPSGTPAEANNASADGVFGIVRDKSLLTLAIAFVVVVAAVAMVRGLLAILALVASGAILVKFVLPALTAGEPGLPVALVGSAAIMFVVLYLAHGVSMRTSAALAGTLAGIAITAAIAQYAVGSVRLSGVSDEAATTLSGAITSFNFRGLLVCAVVIAGLGVLNDVTITQASAVWELRAASADMSRRKIFRSAMRIGRDHIASTIYTITFAYAGATMSVLLLLYIYNEPVHQLLTQENLATEIVRTLCSAIGLVLAVPITTALATVLVPGPRAAGSTPATVPTDLEVSGAWAGVAGS